MNECRKSIPTLELLQESPIVGQSSAKFDKVDKFSLQKNIGGKLLSTSAGMEFPELSKH